MNYAKKYAIAVECLLDYEEAQNLLKERWYGTTDREDIPWGKMARAFFAQLQPRVGMLGWIDDRMKEGGQFIFFTSTSDPVQGERAEQWLREWTSNPFLVLQQTKNPAHLDAQVIFLPGENDTYEVPTNRLRVATVPKSGAFNGDDYQWAWDLDSDGEPPKPRKTAASKA